MPAGIAPIVNSAIPPTKGKKAAKLRPSNDVNKRMEVEQIEKDIAPEALTLSPIQSLPSPVAIDLMGDSEAASAVRSNVLETQPEVPVVANDVINPQVGNGGNQQNVAPSNDIPDINEADVARVQDFFDNLPDNKLDRARLLQTFFKENEQRKEESITIWKEFTATAPAEYQRSAQDVTNVVERIHVTALVNKMQARLPTHWKAAQRLLLRLLMEGTIVVIKIALGVSQAPLEEHVDTITRLLMENFGEEVTCVGDRSIAFKLGRLFFDVRNPKYAEKLRSQSWISPATQQIYCVPNTSFGDVAELSRTLGIMLTAVENENPATPNLLKDLATDANLGSFELSLCRLGIPCIHSVAMKGNRVFINVTREASRIEFLRQFPRLKITIPVSNSSIEFRYSFQSSASELKLVLPLAPAGVSEKDWRGILDKIYNTKDVRFEVIPVSTRDGKARTAGYIFCNDIPEYNAFLGLVTRIPWTDNMGRIREYVTIPTGEKRKRVDSNYI